MQPAGGVQQDVVVAVIFRVRHCLAGNIHRIGGAHFKYRHPCTLPNHLQLRDSGRSVNVARHQQRTVALAFEHAGQLRRMSGFTGTLQTAHHHRAGRMVGGGEADGLTAHKAGQLFVDDLDDHLGRRQAFHHLSAHRACGDCGGEILRHLVVDIRLQQRQAHLAHGLLDIGFGQLAFGTQPLKGCGEFVGKSFKGHVYSPSSCRDSRD